MEPREEVYQFNLTSMNTLSPSPQSDRLTLKINAYYETYGEDPVGRQVTVSRLLSTLGVEPFIRKFKAELEPKPLFLGDIPRDLVGYILVTNLEGLRLQYNPSPEEREEISRRVAILDGFEIYPLGMPFLGQASFDAPLMIHCPTGSAILEVSIFPR